MLELSEQVNVWVMFKGSLIEPLVFFWKGRQIKVEKINFIHTTKDGNSSIYHFSVSSAGNFYKLGFEPGTLKWFLEAVEEE